MKTALHFHTKLSDWIDTNEEIIDLIIKLWIDLFAPTEHDIVNKELVKLWKENNIICCEWVEVSAYDEISETFVHLLVYANDISWEIDDILINTRKWKREKIEKQINLLKNNWFIIDYNEFIEFFKNEWFNLDNLNIWHIAHYIYLNEGNKKHVNKLVNNNVNIEFFKDNFLKWNTKFSKYWTVKIPNYAPSVDKILEICQSNWYFVSLAHPNLVFKNNINKIISFFINYNFFWLDWIEIPTSMNKEIVTGILKFQKKYKWLIITPWSDYHWIIDNTHWSLWKINPFINWILESEIRKFEEKLWLY